MKWFEALPAAASRDKARADLFRAEWGKSGASYEYDAYGEAVQARWSQVDDDDHFPFQHCVQPPKGHQ